jgi:hypothetical protein
MPTGERIIFNAYKRRLQSIRIQLLKRDLVCNTVLEMPLYQRLFIFFRIPWDVFSKWLWRLGYQKPVGTVFGSGDDQVVAVFEECIESQGRRRKARRPFGNAKDALGFALKVCKSVNRVRAAAQWILTSNWVGFENIQPVLICNPPHFLSDSTMNAICSDNKVTCIRW